MHVSKAGDVSSSLPSLFSVPAYKQTEANATFQLRLKCTKVTEQWRIPAGTKGRAKFR